MINQSRETLEEVREKIFDVLTQDALLSNREHELLWSALGSVHDALREDLRTEDVDEGDS